jgi:hypothetical protein
MPIETVISCWGDFYLFVLCEPDTLLREARERWQELFDEASQIALINAGRMVYLDPPVRGSFACRITTGALTAQEQQIVRHVEPRFWLDVRGYELIFGDLRDEFLDNGEPNDTTTYLLQETRIPCEPGCYRVEVYDLLGLGFASLEEAPAFVLRLAPLNQKEPTRRMEQLPYTAWRLADIAARGE